MAEPLQTRLSRQALQLAESLYGAGIQQVPRTRGTRPLSPPPAVPPASDIPAPPATDTGPPAPSDTLGPGQVETRASAPASAPPQVMRPQALTLETLREEVAVCTKCHELATTRSQTVFGVGNPAARLCFLGEAPGADEDRQGEPFVGRAGQLLNKIIEACQLKREDVYILNVIKCRPPGNRNPLPEEATNCRPYLDRQLELIQPEFICCLGAVATQNLLGTMAPMSRMRGKIHDYQGIKVVCTYHPAYLLRNPAAKKDTWEDMKFLMRAMGTPLD